MPVVLALAVAGRVDEDDLVGAGDGLRVDEDAAGVVVAEIDRVAGAVGVARPEVVVVTCERSTYSQRMKRMRPSGRGQGVLSCSTLAEIVRMLRPSASQR